MSADAAAKAFFKNQMDEVASYCLEATPAELLRFCRCLIRWGGATTLLGPAGKRLEDRLLAMNSERKLHQDLTERERFAVCHLNKRVAVPVERRAIVYEHGRPICCFSIVGDRSDPQDAIKQVSILRERCGRADSTPLAPLTDGTARPTIFASHE